MPEETYYIIYDDGTLETLIIAGDGLPEPVLDKPGRITSKLEYDQYKALRDEQNAVFLAELEATEQATRKTDYDALIAAGVPEDTARRLTGYTGP